jgi:peroxiredoxin
MAAVLLVALGPAHAGSLGKSLGKAADFQATDLDGDKVALADLLGKGPILVDFWATWCKPCLKEMPYIQRLHEEYGERGLQVLAVTIDAPRSQSRVKPLVRGKKFTFRVLLDPGQNVFRKLQGKGQIPYVVVLDPDGQIRYRHTGYRPGDEKELEKVIVELFEEFDTVRADETAGETAQDAAG